MYKKNNFNNKRSKFANENSKSTRLLKKQKIIIKKVYMIGNKKFIVMDKKEIKRIRIRKKIFKEFILKDLSTLFDCYKIEIVNIKNNNKKYVVEIKIKDVIFQLIN